MKKVKIKDTDLLTVMGNTNKSNILGFSKMFLSTKIYVDEYVLLCKKVDLNGHGIHSGIISFGQKAFDLLYIGMFSISNPFHTNLSVYSSSPNIKFYRVEKDGIPYIAIKKMTPRMDGGVWLSTMHSDKSAVFEVVDANQLANISAI